MHLRSMRATKEKRKSNKNDDVSCFDYVRSVGRLVVCVYALARCNAVRKGFSVMFMIAPEHIGLYVDSFRASPSNISRFYLF